MDRREALRLLATATALQLAPHNLLAVLREARRLVDTPAAPRTLNANQDSTVKAMAELILPKTETPGASDVGVNEFIDLMLTEWYDEQDRTRFLSGLAEVDSRTKTLFGKIFVDASLEQQGEILIWLGQKTTTEPNVPRSGSRQRRTSYRNFYSMFRHLTLTAYYTSESGATGELHFQMIPDSYDGCVEVTATKGGPENQ
jgi:gluconate 2-dehydrogenase gamma chain